MSETSDSLHDRAVREPLPIQMPEGRVVWSLAGQNETDSGFGPEAHAKFRVEAHAADIMVRCAMLPKKRPTCRFSM